MLHRSVSIKVVSYFFMHLSYFSAYSGNFNIPVTCLLPPDKEYLVREADEMFIECLKHEMLQNRTCDVAPIVVTVRLSYDEQFDIKHPKAYTYDTIGGNHSRIALQRLITENKELAKDPTFSSRRVSVYGRMSAEQAQHLAHRHNRATEFTSKMNQQDKVRVYTCNSCLNLQCMHAYMEFIAVDDYHS